jgi:deazaflavin-dependent oxidoreductase (nitroreductase family)
MANSTLTPPGGDSLATMASWNDAVIEQFRANDGVLGGPWEGKTTLLLHTPGRKTGKVTINPVVAAPHGDAYIICGSGGGAPNDPQWVANLEVLDRPVTIELGSEALEAEHRVVRPDRDDEWAELYGVWREYWPSAADYETKTDRKFPVAIITP